MEARHTADSNKRLYHIVRNNLRKVIPSQGRTVIQMILSGDYHRETLVFLNTAFPTNSYGKADQNDVRYSSMDAVKQFIQVISSGLTRRELYELADLMLNIEVETNHEQLLRTSTLAKYLLLYELTLVLNENPQLIPFIFFSHFKNHVAPLYNLSDPGQIDTFNGIIDFNIVRPFEHSEYPEIYQYMNSLQSNLVTQFHLITRQLNIEQFNTTTRYHLNDDASTVAEIKSTLINEFAPKKSASQSLSSPKLFRMKAPIELGIPSEELHTHLNDVQNQIIQKQSEIIKLQTTIISGKNSTSQFSIRKDARQNEPIKKMIELKSNELKKLFTLRDSITGQLEQVAKRTSARKK